MKVNQTITEVFPNSHGELMNKHSLEVNAAINKFQQIYQNLYPDYITIAKGVATVVKTKETQLFMGIEKSIFICMKINEKMSDIYINSNFDEEEVILSYKGGIKSEKSEIATQYSDLYQLSIDDLSLTKTHGAIIYMHSNIQENLFNRQQALTMGIFTSFLKLNGIFEDLNEEEICKKLNKLNQSINQKISFQDYLSLEHNKIMIKYHQERQNIQINSDKKFILFKLPNDIEKNQKQIQEDIIHYLMAKLFSRQLKVQQFYVKLAEIQECSKKTAIKNLSQAYPYLLEIPNFIVQNGEYLMFVCDKVIHSEIINRLSKILITIHKQSESQQSTQNFGLQTKWNNKYNIRKHLFSTFACSTLHLIQAAEQQEFDCLI